MLERLINRVALANNKKDSLLLTVVDIALFIAIGIFIGLAIAKTMGAHL